MPGWSPLGPALYTGWCPTTSNHLQAAASWAKVAAIQASCAAGSCLLKLCGWGLWPFVRREKQLAQGSVGWGAGEAYSGILELPSYSGMKGQVSMNTMERQWPLPSGTWWRTVKFRCGICHREFTWVYSTCANGEQWRSTYKRTYIRHTHSHTCASVLPR